MGAAISTVTTLFAWCACSSISSLCGACFATNKDDSVPPSATSGRKRSVLLLLLAVAIALIYQYTLAPAIYNNGFKLKFIPGLGKYLVNSWEEGCEQYNNNAEEESAMTYGEICRGQSGVYRVGASATVYFALAALFSKFKPTANRIAWGAKYACFVLMCLSTIFVPNGPFFDVYVHIARVGAALFIILQQLIFIDMAYNWNDSWVSKADDAERLEGMGKGQKWLAAILISCAVLFIFFFVSIGFLFHHFGGCDINDAFLSVTLVAGLLVTAVQLSGEDGSLLTSAILSAYSVYLVFTAMSKNPEAECNPRLGKSDVFGIIVGLFLTCISLAWTGFSMTAEDRLTNEGSASMTKSLVANEQSPINSTNEGVGGNVIGDDTAQNDNDEQENETSANDFSAQWKLNVVLMFISCWFSMTLTGWGSVQSAGSVANPDAGKVSMWMIIASQWLALTLYLWTLVAPRLFPDRDFS